jgi:GNAT superfamily N-acetyltransferase
MTALDGEKDAAGVKLLPAITGTLLGRFRIRRGTADDVAACDRIARQQEKAQPSSLGWVMKQSYTANNHTFHVGEVDGIIRGFVLFSTPTRGKNKSWHVVHALAVQPGWEGWGIGRNLLYSVPTPIRLKCPQTVGKTPRANPANAFYRNAGMQLAGTEAGKHRALNVWEMRRLIIFCAGGNVAYPALARASRQAYGIRSDYTAFDWPFMVDAPFKPEHWNWSKHIRAINTLRPVAALVRDYGTYDGVTVTKAEMLRQVQALRDCGVLRIFVCPKSHGAIQDIPADCGIAISVDSSYAGFLPDFRELNGRFVHLLGGVPQQWLDLIPKIEGHGAHVISCDGSSHESGSKRGSHWHWETHKWNGANGKKADYYGTIPISGRNIVRIMNASDGSAQLPLWAA